MRNEQCVKLIKISLLNKHCDEIKYFMDERIQLNSNNYC